LIFSPGKNEVRELHVTGIAAAPTAVVPTTLTKFLRVMSLDVCPELPQHEQPAARLVNESSFFEIAIFTSLLFF
jgi:hypothetical protein